MDDLTHTVTITVAGNYPHGAKTHAQVIVAGEGDLEHKLSAFRAAIVASGFSLEAAASLQFVDKP